MCKNTAKICYTLINPKPYFLLGLGLWRLLNTLIILLFLLGEDSKLKFKDYYLSSTKEYYALHNFSCISLVSSNQRNHVYQCV